MPTELASGNLKSVDWFSAWMAYPGELSLLIRSAISHIRNQLNQHLRNSFELSEDVAIMSNILEQDGTVVNGVSNKLLLFLVNVEKEDVGARSGGSSGFGLDRGVVGRPPLFLNLYLMVAANFTDYTESLKFLSNTVSFFQRNPVLDHQNTPDMDRRITKLALDIENMKLQDLSTLWGALSGRYLPSILYKVRTIMVDSDDVGGLADTVRRAAPSVFR